MGRSSDIKAGKAHVEAYFDKSPLVKGMKAASADLKRWGATITSAGAKLTAVGAAIAGPLIAATKHFMTAGDALDKMSARVGASVEFLSKLGYAAELGGTNLAALEAGFKRMQRTAFDASQGLKAAVDAFAELGVTSANASGGLKGSEQLFMETVAAMAAMTDHTKKAALAQVIFGRAGTALLPMLKEGKAGLQAAMEEAKKLGIVMSTEQATAAAVLTDAWLRVTASLKMAAAMIGSELAPMLTDWAGQVKDLIGPLIQWIKQNGALIVTLLKVGVALAAVGAAITATGATIAGLGVIIGALASPVGIAVAGLAGLAAAGAAIAAKYSGATRELVGFNRALESQAAIQKRLTSAGTVAVTPEKIAILEDQLRKRRAKLRELQTGGGSREDIEFMIGAVSQKLAVLETARALYAGQEAGTTAADRKAMAEQDKRDNAANLREFDEQQRRRRAADDRRIGREDEAITEQLRRADLAKAGLARAAVAVAATAAGRDRITGTFSARAATGMGAGNWQEKLVAGQNKMAAGFAAGLVVIAKIQEDLEAALRFAPG